MGTVCSTLAVAFVVEYVFVVVRRSFRILCSGMQRGFVYELQSLLAYSGGGCERRGKLVASAGAVGAILPSIYIMSSPHLASKSNNTQYTLKGQLTLLKSVSLFEPEHISI